MPVPNLNDPFKNRGVTAILGPTNTGKTHFALERMLGHKSGLIGLPLRLLAREVYQRLVERVGSEAVALITGEEKIRPREPRYWVATVEAMPRDLSVSFVAIDEVQLAADRDRGHVFTNAMLNLRGTEETILIGSATIRPLLEELVPGANIVSRPRLSKLTFAGERKLSRLPPRSAIVAFSAEEVYAIAELLRRERGGAAVVLGALSPRTRNAQVALFQSGEVEHIVATDAIGMGLNLDVDHVAFAADRKFDGEQTRRLYPAEMAQIAGRAGRHLRDGTFGTTGRCPPLDEETVEALEEHRFDPVRLVKWRNPDLDFSSIADLQASLALSPTVPGLVRAQMAEDEATLDILAARPEIRALCTTREAIARLWDTCKLPDYRKTAPHIHADLVESLFLPLMRRGKVSADWFKQELAASDRTDGDIDTLSARIAEVRTWTYCANRPDWLDHPAHWQNVARALEDRLSDALHEKLAQRFIDRRTSVLMRRLRENAMLEAEITDSGDVLVESQHLGRLDGFRFTPDTRAEGPETKALKAAAAKALANEIASRARKFAESGDDTFALSVDGTLRWIGAPVGRLQAGDKPLEPRVLLLADELLAGPAREGVEKRLQQFVAAHVAKLLGPLTVLASGEGLTGAARGIGYQVAENFGILDRSKVADVVKGLDQQQRGELRTLGIRFGAYHIYAAGLMKPAPRTLAAQLYALGHNSDAGNVADVSHLANSGRTSIPVDAAIARDLYRAAGFRVCGERAVRIDILERLADLIRPALAWRDGGAGSPPAGAYPGGGFTVTGTMTSLVGCAGEDFASILASLGYRKEMKPLIAPPATPVAPAPAETAPDTVAEAEAAPQGEETAAGETAIGETAAGETPAVEGSTLESPAEATPAPEAAPATEAAPEPAAVTEPPLVAVWRPGRPDHDRRRRPDHRPRQGAARDGAARDGAATSGEPARTQEGRRSGERPENRRHERPDGGKPHFRDRPREDRKDDRPRGGKPGGKPFGKPGGKGDRRDDRPREERSWQSAPQQKKGPDLDSPFAKLMELKARLDGKS